MKVRCVCVALGAEHNNKQQVVVMETARQLVPNHTLWLVQGDRQLCTYATDRPAHIRRVHASRALSSSFGRYCRVGYREATRQLVANCRRLDGWSNPKHLAVYCLALLGATAFTESTYSFAELFFASNFPPVLFLIFTNRVFSTKLLGGGGNKGNTMIYISYRPRITTLGWMKSDGINR